MKTKRKYKHKQKIKKCVKCQYENCPNCFIELNNCKICKSTRRSYETMKEQVHRIFNRFNNASCCLMIK